MFVYSFSGNERRNKRTVWKFYHHFLKRTYSDDEWESVHACAVVVCYELQYIFLLFSEKWGVVTTALRYVCVFLFSILYSQFHCSLFVAHCYVWRFCRVLRVHEYFPFASGWGRILSIAFWRRYVPSALHVPTENGLSAIWKVRRTRSSNKRYFPLPPIRSRREAEALQFSVFYYYCLCSMFTVHCLVFAHIGIFSCNYMFKMVRKIFLTSAALVVRINRMVYTVYTLLRQPTHTLNCWWRELLNIISIYYSWHGCTDCPKLRLEAF